MVFIRNKMFSKLVYQPLYAIKQGSRRLVHTCEDFSRFGRSVLRSYSAFKQNASNQKELRIFGLRRSGNHAITNWIINQLDGQVLYLNNIPINANPFRIEIDRLHDYHPETLPKYKSTFLKEASGEFSEKDCLICSFEDYSLSTFSRSLINRFHDFYVGKSNRIVDVLIIRDPYNLFASRLKSGRYQAKSFKSLPDLWVEYAMEYLGQTKSLQNNRVLINYNYWVSSKAYREKIARNLGLTFTDAGLDEVSSIGGGSSFDRCLYGGKAAQMNVLDRWQAYSSNPLFINLINSNSELHSLSREIFGDILGTVELGTKEIPD